MPKVVVWGGRRHAASTGLEESNPTPASSGDAGKTEAAEGSRTPDIVHHELTSGYDERSIVVPFIFLERFFMSVDRFPQYVDADISRWSSLVRGIAIAGEETIETPAGIFETVHLTRETGTATVHYWVSPDVPGEIVRVATASDPAEEDIALELMSIE